MQIAICVLYVCKLLHVCKLHIDKCNALSVYVFNLLKNVHLFLCKTCVQIATGYMCANVMLYCHILHDFGYAEKFNFHIYVSILRTKVTCIFLEKCQVWQENGLLICKLKCK